MATARRRDVRAHLPVAAVLVATLCYGSTFVIVQDALHRVTPMGFILLRFGIGALVLAPVALFVGWRAAPIPGPVTADRSGRGFVVAVLVMSVVLFAGYGFQNAGLQHTSSSNSAFITGLFVVFTPLVETVWYRRAPSPRVLCAVVLVAIGLFLLTGSQVSMGRGDALTLACAACFAIWTVQTAVHAPRFHPIAITAAQLGMLAVLSIPWVVVQGIGRVDGGVWAAAALTGVGCSALAFSLQTWAQRRIDPSRTAILLTLEPVTAGVVGWFVGERLGVRGYVGAAVILAGVVVVELGTRGAREWRSSRVEASAGATGAS
ncbi:MAG: DMT(drug/metabolite transporter) superfamily permease [Actinomycetia bacterium]|nr:DMT(drug/metabolite transporter) superfamily permease [Actinomycetes bacterium]